MTLKFKPATIRPNKKYITPKIPMLNAKLAIELPSPALDIKRNDMIGGAELGRPEKLSMKT